MSDPFKLDRFVEAQVAIYEQALRELRAGRKRTHWMWFIFPQAEGLGHSAMAQQYAISSLDEAKAYLAHPVLGPRLHQCAQALLDVTGKTATDIMGSPDDLKLRSSATLLAAVSPKDSVFHQLLDRYFSSQPDSRTTHWLESSHPNNE